MSSAPTSPFDTEQQAQREATHAAWRDEIRRQIRSGREEREKLEIKPPSQMFWFNHCLNCSLMNASSSTEFKRLGQRKNKSQADLRVHDMVLTFSVEKGQAADDSWEKFRRDS